MKHLLIDMGEAMIFGILFAVLLGIMGIDVTHVQMGILVGFAIIVIGILNAIGLKLKGEPQTSTLEESWRYKYTDNTILLRYRGFKLELLINDEVQVSKNAISAATSSLTGKLPNGEEVKAVATNGVNSWTVTVDGEELVAE